MDIHIYFSGKRTSQMPRTASPLPCWCPLRFITSLFIDITDGTFCLALENHPPTPLLRHLFATLQCPLTLHFASDIVNITVMTNFAPWSSVLRFFRVQPLETWPFTCGSPEVPFPETSIPHLCLSTYSSPCYYFFFLVINLILLV